MRLKLHPLLTLVCCQLLQAAATTVLGDASSNTCPAGSSKITTNAACMAVAQANGATFDIEAESTYPGGCYVFTSSGNVYLNTAPGSGHAGSQLICEETVPVPSTTDYPTAFPTAYPTPLPSTATATDHPTPFTQVVPDPTGYPTDNPTPLAPTPSTPSIPCEGFGSSCQCPEGRFEAFTLKSTGSCGAYITTIDECDIAAKALGGATPILGQSMRTINRMDSPPGCFVNSAPQVSIDGTGTLVLKDMAIAYFNSYSRAEGNDVECLISPFDGGSKVCLCDTSCTPCPAGKYAVGSGVRDECTACPIGRWSEVGAIECLLCTAGQFSGYAVKETGTCASHGKPITSLAGCENAAKALGHTM